LVVVHVVIGHRSSVTVMLGITVNTDHCPQHNTETRVKRPIHVEIQKQIQSEVICRSLGRKSPLAVDREVGRVLLDGAQKANGLL